LRSIGIFLNGGIFTLSYPARQGKSRRLASLPDPSFAGLHIASGSGFVARGSVARGETMRAIVALYLVIGVVLLAIGFLLPGPCPNRNTEVVSNIVFALTWPVGLYAEVYQGKLSAQEWLHRQACEGGGGLGEKKPAPG
jgi:hypothetical protein